MTRVLSKSHQVPWCGSRISTSLVQSALAIANKSITETWTCPCCTLVPHDPLYCGPMLFFFFFSEIGVNLLTTLIECWCLTFCRLCLIFFEPSFSMSFCNFLHGGPSYGSYYIPHRSSTGICLWICIYGIFPYSSIFLALRNHNLASICDVSEFFCVTSSFRR